MNRIRAWLLVAIASAGLALALGGARMVAAATAYVPRPVWCAGTLPKSGSPLCSTIPGDIGPDPMLKPRFGYHGIFGALPTSADTDVETPFDNLSWQTFVALNWTRGEETKPAEQGLKSEGPRVWEGWSRVAEVFGNSPVLAKCSPPPGAALFQIGADGKGNPDGHNEEYIQAATGDPAIDVGGNWTIYERRINNIEIAYLKAPNGKASWNLTTLAGQTAFINGGGTVNFPAKGDNGAANGAIEVKAAWRILNPANHAANAKKYYVIRAYLTVAPSLVDHGTKAIVAPICQKVDLGLVAMHIIQKNPTLTNSELEPKWFWSTFEHVDNAPLAKAACSVTDPASCTTLNQLDCPPQMLLGAPAWSYFDKDCPDCKTNQPPQLKKGQKAFLWNPREPFADAYRVPVTSHGKQLRVGTQVSRCFAIYPLTAELNKQWRAELRKVGSVFANYMLIGTQWGANIEPTGTNEGPLDAVPNYLSNSVVETYLQTFYDPKNPFNTGSCVSCHSLATLPAETAKNVSSNLSFVPGLAQPALLRRPPLGAPGHATEIRRE